MSVDCRQVPADKDGADQRESGCKIACGVAGIVAACAAVLHLGVGAHRAGRARTGAVVIALPGARAYCDQLIVHCANQYNHPSINACAELGWFGIEGR